MIGLFRPILERVASWKTGLALSIVAGLGFSGSAEAAKPCYADFQVAANQQVNTAELYMGDVKWPNMKNECLDAAENKMRNDGVIHGKVISLIKSGYAPIGSQTFNNICKQGYIQIRIAAKVDARFERTKYRTVSLQISCTKTCKCSNPKYWETNAWGGGWCNTAVCTGLTPPPPDNVSMASSNGDYFFYAGQLRHRMRAVCTYTDM